jgi:dTDP-L-rhamnose 4-epimerase
MLTSENRVMHVLLTGGAGFIGSHVVDRLLEAGHRVTVVDNLDPQVHGADTNTPRNLAHHGGTQQLEFIRGDVRDLELMRTLVARTENVVHLAAAVGVGQSMYSPAYYADVNVNGQAVLMEAMVAHARNIRRFVVASSMSIYGEGAYECAEHGSVIVGIRPEAQLKCGEWEPVCPQCGKTVSTALTKESQPLLPTSIYAITKKTQEEMALCFGEAYGIPSVALRFFNVFGSRQALSNPYTGAAAIFSGRLLNGEAPLLFEDGEQSRDFIHVRDVARAVVRAVEQENVPTAPFNVCSGRAMTVGELARSLATALNESVAPKLIGRYRVGDIRHCIGDPGAARQELGFTASMDLEAGLSELLAWVRAESAGDHLVKSLDELASRGLVR